MGTSRDGAPNVGIRSEGRIRWYHSQYGAKKEADRLTQTVPERALVVAVGLGAGHQVASLVARGTRVQVFEPDDFHLVAGLMAIDLSEAIRGRMVRFLAAHDASHIAGELSRSYVPFLDGPIATLRLRSRIEAEPERMIAATKHLDRALSMVRSDLAVQARHGRRWLRNTLINLPHAEGEMHRPIPRFAGQSVALAAAGPTLRPAELLHPIVAVDTALPILASYGIRPELSVAIDCQIASVYHLAGSSSRGVPVVVDLSGAPSLLRTIQLPVPALTRHPFHQLLRMLGWDAPFVDVAAGSVTHTALELTDRLGAVSITVHGADFSYPGGETYARGSAIHRVFEAKGRATQTLATLHRGFLYNRPGVQKHPTLDVWTQPGLSEFAASFALLAHGVRAKVTRVSPGTPPLPQHGDSAESLVPEIPPARSPDYKRLESILGTTLDLVSSVATETELRGAIDSGGEREAAARAILPTTTWAAASAGRDIGLGAIYRDISKMMTDTITELRART